jgi:hypothetical protein
MAIGTFTRPSDGRRSHRAASRRDLMLAAFEHRFDLVNRVLIDIEWL